MKRKLLRIVVLCMFPFYLLVLSVDVSCSVLRRMTKRAARNSHYVLAVLTGVLLGIEP